MQCLKQKLLENKHQKLQGLPPSIPMLLCVLQRLQLFQQAPIEGLKVSQQEPLQVQASQNCSNRQIFFGNITRFQQIEYGNFVNFTNNL
jgi:hypothetical protein